jgi:hypothetical protein
VQEDYAKEQKGMEGLGGVAKAIELLALKHRPSKGGQSVKRAFGIDYQSRNSLN